MKLGKIAKAAINPVGAGIQKFTGISQGKQLAMGAGIGAGMYGANYVRGSTAAAGSNIGPVADGSAYSSSLDAGGIARASDGSMTNFNPWSFAAPVVGAGADIWSANKYAQGQQEANATNLQSARENMAFQAEQTKQQMAYQTEMSNTAHQREVSDLKAAGLNPVLSANSGASTPVGASGSGAQSSVSNANPNYGGIIPKGVDTAVRLKQMQKDFETADSGIYLNAAAADRELANAKVARNSARKIAAEADLSEMTTSYAKRHPYQFGIGQFFKYATPGVDTAVGLGEAYAGTKRDLSLSGYYRRR